MGVSGCKFEVFEWKLAVFGMQIFVKIPHNRKLDVRYGSQLSPKASAMTLERKLAMFYSPQAHARFNALGES